ncbi:hypothetical protein QYE76_045352 [Lolium multiflorum]|uniref:Aminotransferase-like plant mobile domain-containing protein n=1 Tax=Lolium multiflorum TaxID=4521 RepID=A0AAD8TKA9_LOLMU|nr:hypothetical protein QYE76_045352 [Lolium multiflorum]
MPMWRLLPATTPTDVAPSTLSWMVWLLDEEYERDHRVVHMTERTTDLHPLKIRYHGTVDIDYDERYTEFIQPTGLMPFISLVSRGGPNMNPSALTALVDRWRPETHTFHLRAGEMAPTLQDVSMILGLPIQGEPLCMNTASDGWRQQMEVLIGRAPPLPEQPKKRAPAGASFSWIRTNFGECPEEADEDTRRTYARVYLWYMISRTLFPDSGGKLAHWCWLKALTVLDNRWSWGTAALAYLYRQLDEACRRTGSRTGSGGIGGCMLLLSVWSWDHLSVGRPRVLNERPWPHHPNNPDREPTWAYLWDNVSEMTSDPMVMYRQYTAELDTLTAEQVEWEPYGSYYHIGSGMADLNHKCTEEARFWRMRCPLICMWLVEHHQPQRVMRQFGLYQECPPVWQDTDKAAAEEDHKLAIISGHIAAFQHCLEAARNAGPEQIVPHDFAAFNNYLEWFHENTRIELVKHAYPEEILDDPIQFDEVGQSQHDTFARRGRSTSIASELNFVREEIQKTAEECEVMWEQSGRDDKPVGPLRYFIKIPEDELILSQGILPKHTSKQAPRSAYQLKPRGKGPNRYTPEDYVNRGKKVVTEEDEGPPRRSALSRMRNDEPFSSDGGGGGGESSRSSRSSSNNSHGSGRRGWPSGSSPRGRHVEDDTRMCYVLGHGEAVLARPCSCESREGADVTANPTRTSTTVAHRGDGTSYGGTREVNPEARTHRRRDEISPEFVEANLHEIQDGGDSPGEDEKGKAARTDR